MPYQNEDFEGTFDQYRAFKQSGLTFTDKYEVRKQAGFLSSYSTLFVIQFLSSSRLHPRVISRNLWKNLLGKPAR